MSIFKIFPEKDATIYSLYPNANTGLDEIIESTLTTSPPTDPDPNTSRFLIKFPTSDINDVINNKISSSLTWSVNLKVYQANIQGLNLDTVLECFPISGSWGMGTGKYLDEPETTNGVSWNWRTYSGSNYWTTSSFTQCVTASFSSSVTEGGGTWYTGSNTASFNSNTFPITQSQLLSYASTKDIDMNVTNIIKAWVTGAFDNEGFILKQQLEFVDNHNYQPSLKFFSIDTNTIYPPQLEFKWRDYNFTTGSSSNTIINTTPLIINITENPGFFYSGSINRFRINARPQYPIRVYQTQSVYTNNYYLPTASYYAIKDLKTNEFIINFDSTYTQISADSTSSYFDIYMSGLEPERYYEMLIKTTVNGSTTVYSNNYYFKVING